MKRSFTLMAGLLITVAIILTMGFIPEKVAKTDITNNTKMTNDTTKTYSMVATRVFNAPIASVWKAWSDADQVMKWWGPIGFTSPSCDMNFKVSGVTLVCMRAPKEYGGQDMYNTWTYRKIVPMERIEFVLNFADKDGNKLDPAAMGLPPGIPKDVPHVVTFKAIGDSKTEITVTEYGYASQQASDISKAGLEQCLDKMAAIFVKN